MERIRPGRRIAWQSWGTVANAREIMRAPMTIQPPRLTFLHSCFDARHGADRGLFVVVVVIGHGDGRAHGRRRRAEHSAEVCHAD